MLRKGVKYLFFVGTLPILIYFLIGCGAMTYKGPGSNWTPAMFDKGEIHIHYARPPLSKWADFPDPEVSLGFYNKETGTVISFSADHFTEKTDPKEAFEEFQEGLRQSFQGRLSRIEEPPVLLPGFPGYYAKVEGVRAKDQSKVYFFHYFFSKNGRIMTFDATQPAAVSESKRKQDLEAFAFFIHSFQFH